MRQHLIRRLGFLVVIAGLLPRPALAVPADPDGRDPRIEKILSQISEQRLTEILQKLGSFGTRNTLSSTDSTTKGIGAARQWIFDEMKKSSSRLQVSFDTYQVPKGGRITRDIELRNVVAVLPGKSARRIYVSGHYDSFAAVRPAAGSARAPGRRRRRTGAGRRPPPGRRPGSRLRRAPVDNLAPGVNDDGTGTALVMELARVFGESGVDFDATLVFVAFAGEEQGLIGATRHAEKAAADKLVIDAVLNNDMVGNVQAGDGLEDSIHVRVFSEGPEDSPSRQLARYIVRAGAKYVPTEQVTLVARYDRFGRGGDHTAFNQKGFTAVRITESVENYERQHTAADTFEGVNIPYFVRNVRLNAADDGLARAGAAGAGA